VQGGAAADPQCCLHVGSSGNCSPVAVCIIAIEALLTVLLSLLLLVVAAVASQPPVVHVDCLAVNWVEGTLSPGLWSLRCAVLLSRGAVPVCYQRHSMLLSCTCC
jgi:hypothetical protein